MKRKLIYDCDNTMGLPNCDVDDGLTLLYLLSEEAKEESDLLAVCSTFGNNKTDIVFENTNRMLSEIKREDIKVYKGGVLPKDYDNEASRYLAEAAKEYEGELEILATGSLTNIAGAYRYNKDFFSQVKSITLMGGISEELIFNKKKMNELNFSIDYESSYDVLTGFDKLNIITGNNCLKVLFELEEYKKRLLDPKLKKGDIIKAQGKEFDGLGEYIFHKTYHWFSYNEDVYGIPGFYNWDVTAAVYIFHPELFEDDLCAYSLGKEDLRTGYLRKSEQGINAHLNLPRIKEDKPFKENVYAGILHIK
jgi:hypothetical protein